MERLTYRGSETMTEEDGWIRPSPEEGTVYSCYSTRKIIERLAEYEDLEEQGLLLRLPCPIGTTVYNTTCWDDVTEKVEVNGETVYRIVHRHKVSKSTFSLGDIYNFGKTVFLTKAEADQKLKEMESDCNETN